MRERKKNAQDRQLAEYKISVSHFYWKKSFECLSIEILQKVGGVWDMKQIFCLRLPDPDDPDVIPEMDHGLRSSYWSI